MYRREAGLGQDRGLVCDPGQERRVQQLFANIRAVHWQCVKGLKPGSRAVFTQPPLPFKCPGAPQKIVYLTADRLRRAGALEARTCNTSCMPP